MLVIRGAYIRGGGLYSGFYSKCRNNIVRTYLPIVISLPVLINKFSEPLIWGWFNPGIRVQSRGDIELLGECCHGLIE